MTPGRYELTDAARAAGLLYQHGDALECLMQARVGRMMLARDLEDEVRFAAQEDRFAVVPKLVCGVLRPA
jgi:phosphosulfolactate phosphohydrolase-like enzyme